MKVPETPYMCQAVYARASRAASRAAKNVERERKGRREEPSTVLDTHLSSEEHHLSRHDPREREGRMGHFVLHPLFPLLSLSLSSSMRKSGDRYLGRVDSRSTDGSVSSLEHAVNSSF